MSENEISLSIQETNKLRLSLGLKPLEIDSEKNVSVIVSKDENLEQQDKVKSLQKQIKKQKNQMKLQGKGLADEEDQSILDWAKQLEQKQKQNQVKIARKKLKELDTIVDYSENDLNGLKVGHDISDLQDEVVLVLKDSNILDEEEQEDELVNVNLLEKERMDQFKKLKKGKPTYNAYEEFERQQMGLDKRLLQQYDDFQAPTGFTISRNGIVNMQDIQLQQVTGTLQKGAVSLDYEKQIEKLDYYTKEEMLTFRNPKKKKKRLSRKKEDIPDPDEMQVEQNSFTYSNKKTIDTMNFVDDDDLQSSLASLRKAENKKTFRDPSLVAQRILEQEPEEELKYDGLVISDLSEFVSQLDPTVPENDFLGLDTKESEPKSLKDSEEMHLETMMKVDEGVEDQEAETTKPNIILEEEPLVSDGLAATLRLLQKKGDLDVITDEQRAKEQLLRERAQWMAEQKIRDALNKPQEQTSPSNKRKKDHETRYQEQKRLQIVQDRFRDYKPNVELLYKDQSGRILDAKQAYKELSQKFHGKKSGKNKIEKKMLKMEQELQLKKMMSNDAPLSTQKQDSQRGPEEMYLIVNPSIEVEADPVYTMSHVAVKESRERSISVPAPALAQEPTKGIQSENRAKISFGLSKKRK